MSVPVSFAEDDIDLVDSPIDPDWIIEGQPKARNRILSTSADTTACTIVWDCTAGKFHWYYSIDETVHFVKGRVTIDDGINPPRTLGPGGIVFFPKGSHAIWTVHEPVRKVAFCRTVLPTAANRMIKAARAVKRRLKPSAGQNTLMGPN